MPVVSDTGPLIAFAKADCLAILKRMFGQIHIPPAVYRELMAKSGPEAERLDYALFDFIITTAAPSIPAEVEEATSRLGPGEKQAIALAYEQGALLLTYGRSAGTECSTTPGRESHWRGWRADRGERSRTASFCS
jgi:predicted nucleic acid-binding protein